MDITEPPAWVDQARCRDVPNPDAFYPERGGSMKQVRALCAECRVRAECLAFALEVVDAIDNGIWGGTSPRGEHRRI